MFDKPTYLVQMGWFGKNRIEHGINYDYIDGAVLSPSDYISDTIVELANELNNSSKYVLFDPQFYLPDQGDRDKLNDYDYHDQYGGDDFDSGVFFNEKQRENFFESLLDFQDKLECDAYISPYSHLSSLSKDEIKDWKKVNEWFAKKTNKYGRDIPVFATLSVDGKHLMDDSLRNYLLNLASSLDFEGFYVSVDFSDADSSLPLSGENHVKAYLETMLSLKINRYEVIAANTHQISHLLFPLDIDAFASGHFNNLRSFDTNRWVVPDDPDPKQRVTRYYSDELLDDVRPDHLMTELANQTSVDVSKLQSSPNSPWEDDLFSSGSINAGWPEGDGSWDHYVHSCWKIADQYRGKDKDDRVNHAKSKIRKAKALHKKISSEIDEHTDELDNSFLEDWEDALDEITSTEEFKRI